VVIASRYANPAPAWGGKLIRRARLYVSHLRPSCSDGPRRSGATTYRRADMENRIAELKHDWGPRFLPQTVFPTEAAFALCYCSSICWPSSSGWPPCQAIGNPATIRTQVLTSAHPRSGGRRLVVHLSESWGWIENEDPFAGKHLGL